MNQEKFHIHQNPAKPFSSAKSYLKKIQNEKKIIQTSEYCILYKKIRMAKLTNGEKIYYNSR